MSLPFQHGTASSYWRGCRCYFCHDASLVYRRERRRRTFQSRKVSSVAARRHIRHLGKYGLGVKSIAAACDVGTDTINRIRAGQRIIYVRTERRILSVTAEAAADGCRVDATITHNLLRELLDEGYSLRDLSRALGRKDGSLPWLHRKRVWARTEMRVEKLYRQAMREGSNAFRGRAA